MIVPFIVLVSARAMMSLAARLKHLPIPGVVPHIGTGPMMGQRNVFHTPAMRLRPQVKPGLPAHEYILESWPNTRERQWTPKKLFQKGTENKNAKEPLRPSWGDIGAARYSQQAFPPASIFASDLPNVRDVIAQSSGIFTQLDLTHLYEKLSGRQFEMVGLIPKDFLIGFREGGTPVVDTSVLALGFFSRKKLTDDRRGSLGKGFYEQYGNRVTPFWSRFGRSKKEFDVFAIEGLADAPGLSEQSAKGLLSKLATYAHKEQKMVVVSEQAQVSSDGTDLTEYYVRLGFEKVEMASGLHKLIHTGYIKWASVEDVVVESEQTMVHVSPDRWGRW